LKPRDNNRQHSPELKAGFTTKPFLIQSENSYMSAETPGSEQPSRIELELAQGTNPADRANLEALQAYRRRLSPISPGFFERVVHVVPYVGTEEPTQVIKIAKVHAFRANLPA
jgi:hypothetical protein